MTGKIQETTCVYRRSSLGLTSTDMNVLYTELAEATRMFRSTVDDSDVRWNSIELNGSLWKLLPMYGIRQNIMEGRGG